MSSSKPTVVKFVAVGWTKKGEEVLANELVEAVGLRHLVVKGKGSPQAGTEVSMQYHNEIWEGHILSVHGNLSDAKASRDAFTPNLQQSTDDNGSGGNGRGKRKKRVNKNLFSNEFLTTDSETMTEKSPEQDDGPAPQKKPKKTSKKAKTSSPSKKKTEQQKEKSLNKQKELSLLSQKLDSIKDAILDNPTPDLGHISVSESEMSLSDSEPEDVAPTPPQKQTKPLQHPHFGGKQPKKHILPRCINVACKEEKEKKDEKIKKLTEEVQHLKDEVRKIKEQAGSVLPPRKGQGKMSREDATALGLTELVSGSGVWICPNKLGAAIKDAENKSRTVLVRSLLCAFYDKEELLSKNFSDLDKEITEAAIDFAMVARLGEVKNVRKADLRQALRCKLNSMKFQCSKPEYFQEYRKTYSGPKKEKIDNKEPANEKAAKK